MTSHAIERLLPLLLSCRVSYFKSGDTEIRFSLDEETKPEEKPKLDPKPEATPQANQIPDIPDPNALKGNDMMAFDKILHWSGTPSDEPNSEVALTGDQPLVETSTENVS